MTTTDAAGLWRVQLALEGKGFNGRGRLVRTPCPDPDELAECYVARYHGGGTEIVFAESAPDAFIQWAAAIPLARYFEDSGDLFAPTWTVRRGRFHTYRFAVAPRPPAGAARLEQRGTEHFAVVVDGQTVAEAMSSRSNQNSAELWVYTAAPQQRRGYASLVAAAWARAVLGSGKVAFYSHLDGNAASQALARHLRVVPLFELVAISL